MNNKYNFFIAGRTRNRENILKICRIFDELNISYYCFLKNEESHREAGLDVNDKNLADIFDSLDIGDERVKTIFEHDLNGEKNSDNFLLVLPAGNSAHVEAGIAYGLGKKCYAIGEYDTTDSLYLIFDKIFKNEKELKEFLTNENNK